MQLAVELPDRTTALIESYSQKMGLEKNSFIEDALLRHLQALRELPMEFIIPNRIILSEEGMRQVLDLLENPPEPTEALKQLMNDE
ncbi:MAG: hypothetical protein RL236_412 [Pseudomonadota bacterium]